MFLFVLHSWHQLTGQGVRSIGGLPLFLDPALKCFEECLTSVQEFDVWQLLSACPWNIERGVTPIAKKCQVCDIRLTLLSCCDLPMLRCSFGSHQPIFHAQCHRAHKTELTKEWTAQLCSVTGDTACSWRVTLIYALSHMTYSQPWMSSKFWRQEIKCDSTCSKSVDVNDLLLEVTGSESPGTHL